MRWCLLLCDPDKLNYLHHYQAEGHVSRTGDPRVKSDPLHRNHFLPFYWDQVDLRVVYVLPVLSEYGGAPKPFKSDDDACDTRDFHACFVGCRSHLHNFLPPPAKLLT